MCDHNEVKKVLQGSLVPRSVFSGVGEWNKLSTCISALKNPQHTSRVHIQMHLCKRLGGGVSV